MMIRHEQPNEEFMTNGSLKCGKKRNGKKKKSIQKCGNNKNNATSVLTVLIEGMCNDRK